eukprot:SAG22_NODE_1548_length_4150_cov_2.816095_2_plen_65_part_00
MHAIWRPAACRGCGAVRMRALAGAITVCGSAARTVTVRPPGRQAPAATSPTQPKGSPATLCQAA